VVRESGKSRIRFPVAAKMALVRQPRTAARRVPLRRPEERCSLGEGLFQSLNTRAFMTAVAVAAPEIVALEHTFLAGFRAALRVAALVSPPSASSPPWSAVTRDALLINSSPGPSE
jgi:hypothetical protein